MKYNAFRQRYHARGSGLVWNASIRRRKGTSGPVTPEITFDELVASLLSAGEDVAFYDPNDLTSIYTARTGGANAVADGPVGLMLDKAQMGGLTAAEFIAAQPELVTNGTFDTDVSGWTSASTPGTLSLSSNKLRITADGAASCSAVTTLSGLSVGKSYRLLYDIDPSGIGSGAARFRVETSADLSLGNGPVNTAYTVGPGAQTDVQVIFIATATTMYCGARLTAVVGGNYAEIDNISVHELPGYHATAPSDAARPILRDVSSTYALDFDNVDDAFAWTTPAITDGTWVALTRDGSYAASAAYSAGTYTMPIYQPFDLCAILWTSADLTTVQEAIVLAEGSARGAAADFGGVTDFTLGFRGRTDLRDFPLIDTGSGTNFERTWQNCTSLTSFPLLDVSSGTNFLGAWALSGLTSFPLLDVSSGTDFSVAWFGCSSLTSFPLLDVSNGAGFSNAWFGCTSLTSFPLLDVSSGTNFQSAWDNCTGLTSFPALDLSSATSFYLSWRSCTSLTTFPANMFDSVTATNFGGAFLGTNLTQTSIDNILTSINTAGTSGGTFDQTGGSAPSATGEAAIDALRGRGWTVTVTGGY
jgi:hypothetical protein